MNRIGPALSAALAVWVAVLLAYLVLFGLAVMGPAQTSPGPAARPAAPAAPAPVHITTWRIGP